MLDDGLGGLPDGGESGEVSASKRGVSVPVQSSRVQGETSSGSTTDIGPQTPGVTVAEVEASVDIARTYLDAFASGDPDAIAALVNENFVNEHLSELGSGCIGRDEYRRRLVGFLATFVDATYTIESISALDRPGEVIARYRLTARYEGTPIDITGMMWFEVRDGRIARRTDLWDSLSFLRQTGQAD